MLINLDFESTFILLLIELFKLLFDFVFDGDYLLVGLTPFKFGTGLTPGLLFIILFWITFFESLVLFVFFFLFYSFLFYSDLASSY